VIYVIAANKRIADMVARGKVKKRSDYIFVRSWQQLMAMAPGSDVKVYAYYGGIESNLARNRVLDTIATAKRRGHEVIDVEESELVP
jgi:hypothetical protein